MFQTFEKAAEFIRENQHRNGRPEIHGSMGKVAPRYPDLQAIFAPHAQQPV